MGEQHGAHFSIFWILGDYSPYPTMVHLRKIPSRPRGRSRTPDLTLVIILPVLLTPLRPQLFSPFSNNFLMVRLRQSYKHDLHI